MVRIPTHRPPTHPGEMLLEEFLNPMELTQSELAQAIAVPYQRINEIVNGRRIALVAVFGALRFGPQLVDGLPVQSPSQKIKQLADATTMTPEAQQIFYRQKPTIQPKEAFFKECQKLDELDEGQFLLGCYVSDGQSGKIVIESIPDERFKGMMESIAAHEMLHAAYYQLS